MAVKRNEKGRWIVEFEQRGARIHRRLPEGSTKGDAIRLEAELRTALLETRKASTEFMLEEAIALYLKSIVGAPSEYESRINARRIGPWVIGKTAQEAHKAALRFTTDCLPHYKPASINKSLNCLKRGLSLAWINGLTDENYGAKIKRLPENNERMSWLTVDQTAAIAEHCSPPVKAAVWISLLTGARRGEIVKMLPEHISDDSIYIPAENTKTKKGRFVPIVPALRPWLEFVPLGITAAGIDSTFQRAKVKAGLPTARFHDLRHGCATTLVQLGVDLYTVQQILGHSSSRLTQRYAKVQLAAKSDALEKLGSLVQAAGAR